jgi:PHD/YefM family antitoxin component YafN of YafNO toxin-antitoxin module
MMNMYGMLYVKGHDMLNTNITNFRKNLFGILEQTIKYNEPVNISTKDGNAVVLSEGDYNGLMETLYLCSIPGMKERIAEGLRTPVFECVPEDEVAW